MQHILNIAFEFDDDAVKRAADKAVAQEIDTIITNIVTNRIAPMSTGWYGKQERNWTNLESKIDVAVQMFLQDNREEIIDKASTKLMDSIRRTKAWKEKAENSIC